MGLKNSPEDSDHSKVLRTSAHILVLRSSMGTAVDLLVIGQCWVIPTITEEATLKFLHVETGGQKKALGEPKAQKKARKMDAQVLLFEKEGA